MFHYFKKPARPEDSDYDLIADAFYRIRPFWLPSLLIGAILGFPVLSIFMACMFAPFLAEGESAVEIMKGIAPFFVAGVALVCLGIFLLWVVTLSWRKEDYVSELIRNAEAYGLYDSGIEITVNSGKVIVIPYGTKQSVGRSIKAFKQHHIKNDRLLNLCALDDI